MFTPSSGMLLQVILKPCVPKPFITCAVVGTGVVLKVFPVVLLLELGGLDVLVLLLLSLFILSMTGSWTTICIIRFPCRLTWLLYGYIFKSVLILQIILKTDILFHRLYVVSLREKSATVSFQILFIAIAWYDSSQFISLQEHICEKILFEKKGHGFANVWHVNISTCMHIINIIVFSLNSMLYIFFFKGEIILANEPRK